MKSASSLMPQMAVKIPIKRGKMTSEEKVLESSAAKLTSEAANVCRIEVAEVSKPRRSLHAFSSNANNEDNSSISSRSSMNSGPGGFDRSRDGISEGKSTMYAAATNTTTASIPMRVMGLENHSVAITSPSDQESREQSDHHDSSPDTLVNGKPVPHQHIDATRSFSFTLPPKASSPTPSTTSLDWQFSGGIEDFFEENDRAVGLSLINGTAKINTEGIHLNYQLDSFDSVDRKLLLRENMNDGGSGASECTPKTTNISKGRMPLPSPSQFDAGKSHIATTPLAPPSTSMIDIFSPDINSTEPLYLPQKTEGNACNLFELTPSESNPSRFILDLQPANSFSDLIATTAPRRQEQKQNIQSTTFTATTTYVSAPKRNIHIKRKRPQKLNNRKHIMQVLKGCKESNLLLPTPLGHDSEGHRRFVINGPLKQCTASNLGGPDKVEKGASFRQFLQMLSPAFEGCTFLLPWLRVSDTKCKVTVSLHGSFRLNRGTLFRHMATGPSESDLKIAKRRIQSTICAFGGTINRKKREEDSPVQKAVTFGNKATSSIFRSRHGKTTSPPSPSTSTLTGMKRKRNNNSILRREKYEKKLRDQYFENGNRLSWDVQHGLKLTLSGAKTFDEEDSSDSQSNEQKSDEKDKDLESTRPTQYKCTRCGALKKQHVCTNRPIILRSIGINVYPAANAYTADEPGSLSSPLSEMNNYIMASSDNVCGFISDVAETEAKLSTRSQVMPKPNQNMKYLRNDISSNKQRNRKERKEKRNRSKSLIFQPTMYITNNQYLKIKTRSTERDYSYPDVPLTFSQRKSMSDTLLSISKSVPELTHACAIILKDARGKDKWDQAVAELMAQVLCILHCSSSNDYSLDGLKQYLLEFGICC